MKHRMIVALAATLAISLAPLTFAQEDSQNADRAAELKQRIEETKSRLSLTEEQTEQLIPILEEGFEAQMAVLEEHGIKFERGVQGDRERLGLRAARRLGRDLDAVREETLEKVSGILTDSQLEEYKEIQAERKEAMRGRIQSRR